MLSVLAGFCVLCLVITTALSRPEVHAQAAMKVSGIPESGLVLIGPADPGFEEMASAALKGRRDIVYETFKPYSVILQNKTEKTVVAYVVRLEFNSANGKLVSWQRYFGQVTALLDGNKRKSNPEADRAGPTIPPNAWKIVTPESYIGSESRVTSEASAANDEFRAYLQHLTSRLNQGTGMTASLDGAFFEDGTFVGQDKSGFFDIFKAEVNAKQDLMFQIVSGHRAGRDANEVVNEIKSSLPESGQPILGPGASPSDFYQYFRRLYGSEIVGIRDKLGGQAVLGHAYQQLFQNHPFLMKR
jgi:hypothetical protein